MKRERSKKLQKAVNLFLVSFLTFSVVTATGCNRTPGMPSDEPPAGEYPPDDYAPPPPMNPGDDNNDGQSDLPQEPIDTPDPLPAPPNPVNPGEHMIIKAVAKTTSYILPVANVQGVYVNIDVTWQPVRGAHEYWLYKNILPLKHEVTRNNAYKAIKADGLMSTRFIDGIQPPSMAGGSLWEKIKRGFQAITIRPGVEYKYKVFAVDMDGNVIGESDADITVPLPPVASAVDLRVSETTTTRPLFEWQASNGLDPDGYFVSVYPPIQFGKQSFQPSSFGLAYWSTFRNEGTKVARYGAHSDNLSAYPGSLPFNISFPLRQNNRYSVSITSVKTDSKDMRTAKAISKAWSQSQIFVVGSAAPNPNMNNPYQNNPYANNPYTNNPTVPGQQPDQQKDEKEGIFKKIKGWLGF